MNKRKCDNQLISAGGLVYRIQEEGIEVVICGTRTPQTWRLPKGMIEAGLKVNEDKVVSKLREVIGFSGKIFSIFPHSKYSFL